MGFRAAPVLIAYLFTSNVDPGRDVGGVFEITETDLINENSMTFLAPLDEDIVRFDFYDNLVANINGATSKRN